MRRSNRKQGDPKKAVAYLRVSTDRQEIGPAVQLEEIERWAESNGVELVGTFEDHGVSGAAPVDKRPELLSAVDALGEHGAGVLVVQKRDRLARDVIAAAMIEKLAERKGAVIVAADGAGNGSGPEALLMRRLLDAFSEYERAIIRARIKKAMQVKKSNHEFTGGKSEKIPYGWRLANDGKHIEPEPTEQANVQDMKELQAEGLSLRAIARELESHGVFARNHKSWHPQSIKGAMRAEVA